MTKGMERIINELKGEKKKTAIERLHNENQVAKENKKLRLASDLNNLIFYLNNPKSFRSLKVVNNIKDNNKNNPIRKKPS